MLNPIELSRSLLASACVASTSLAAVDEETAELDPLLVVSDRLTTRELATRQTIELPALGETGITLLELGSAVATDPSYAAFRSTSSRAAHPTTQGVRFRNLGANATSRALVLLDGIPQNDPFGGWVPWQRFHTQSLSGIGLRHSGGGEAWGNLGSGGIISLASIRPSEPQLKTNLVLGDNDTAGASVDAFLPFAEAGGFQFSGKEFETDGFATVRSDQRGPIDGKAGVDVSAYRGQLTLLASEQFEMEIALDHFEEGRSNGTPLSQNETEATDWSFSLRRNPDGEGPRDTFVAYHQDREFSNTFTSVSDERDSEQAVLDQYSVPSQSTGFGLSRFVRLPHDGEILAGIDWREVKGTVNERFRNLGDGFTRERAAGGEQIFYGAYSNLSFELGDKGRLLSALRVDRIEQSDGVRRETDLTTGEILRSDQYQDNRDDRLSASLAYEFEANERFSSYAKAFTGYRSPTLNELYRPFRVKNDIIEANPQLALETHQAIEFGGRYDGGLTQAQASLFYYNMEDSIANVVLSTESGFDPLCGFIPEGGSCGQRGNIPEASLTGAELSLSRTFSESLEGELRLMYARTRVSSFPTQPSLEGNEFPLSAPFRAHLGLVWKPVEKARAWLNASYQERSFEDLSNQRMVDDSIRFDVGGSYALTKSLVLSLAVENVFDAEIETGVSTGGLVSIAAPRSAWLSLDWTL